MKLGELGLEQLSERLRRDGVYLRTGPFVSHLRTPYRDVAAAVYACYGDFTLPSADEFVDFHVHLAPPPGFRRWLRPQVLFSVDDVVAFKPHPRRLAAPILEWGLNWCIAAHAHQFLMIHAAVLERNGRGVILAGEAGAGKSTLCAALVLRGWRLLSDEIALIRPQDGQLVPLSRPVSLKNESIGVIRDFAPEAQLGTEWRDTVKGTVAHMRPPAESVRRIHETASPGWVIFPRYQRGIRAEATRQTRGVALVRLADNSFNYSLLRLRGFQTMARLVDGCDCYKFRYSDLDEAVDRFDRLANSECRTGNFECRRRRTIPSARPQHSTFDIRHSTFDLLWSALRDPATVVSLDTSGWDLLIRQARYSRVLARLAILVDEQGLLQRLPEKIQDHLNSARVVAAKHESIMRWEVNRVHRVLGKVDVPVILLKGGAYVMADLPPGRGRLFSDMDVMVPESELSRVEQTLLEHGWEKMKLNPYDQRYYRKWMHELPPLEHRLRGTVLDLHHTILPPSGRLHPDPAKLLEAAVPLDDGPSSTGALARPSRGLSPIKVLAPADMILHSAAHLFQDGNLAGGLRDLTDMDDLLRYFGPRPGFWEDLVPRAQQLDLHRPLFYALRYTRQFLHTPVPEAVTTASAVGKPRWPALPIMDALARRALTPEHPDKRRWTSGPARWLLYVRSHWLRMPPLLLIAHLFRKMLRRLYKGEEE